MFSRFSSYAALFLAVTLPRGPLRASAPDYASAFAFGRALQQDFSVRGPQALTDRIDEEAMKKRLFAIFDSDTAARWEPTWRETFLPELKDQLLPGSYKSLVMNRVLLLDGDRVIECILLDGAGPFQLLQLRLNSTNGKIGIEDFKYLGFFLEATIRQRELLVLLGVDSTARLNEEETCLSLDSLNDRAMIHYAFQMWREGHDNDCFRIWSHLPPDVQQSAAWKDFRDMLALHDCHLAGAQLEAEYRDNQSGTEPFLKYLYAIQHANIPMGLDAVQRLRTATHDSPIVRVMEADLLIVADRPAEALDEARGIYELNPYVWTAYMSAALAAYKLHRTDAEVDALQHWAMIIPVKKIDAILSKYAPLTSLRTTPEYKAWIEKALPTTPTVPALAAPLAPAS